jgi:hypothetical protein
VSDGKPAPVQYDKDFMPEKSLYDFTYYPIANNSFVEENGIMQKKFPETHWYVPNHSNITYRQICMDMKTKPITETYFK